MEHPVPQPHAALYLCTCTSFILIIIIHIFWCFSFLLREPVHQKRLRNRVTETYRERKRKRDTKRDFPCPSFYLPHHPFPGFKAVCLAFAYTSLAHICCYFPFFAVVYCLHAICEAFFCAFPLFVLLHLTLFLRSCYRASRDAGK